MAEQVVVALRFRPQMPLECAALGRPAESEDPRGGPHLPSYFRSNHSGLVWTFAQVRIDTKDFFPRIVVRVQPLRRLLAR